MSNSAAGPAEGATKKAYRIDVQASRVAIRTEATGLLARLAHDLELVAKHFEGDVEVAGETWTADLRFPARAMAVVGVVRDDSVDERVLSAKDCDEILERMDQAFDHAETIRVRARGSSPENGSATVSLGAGEHTVGLRPKVSERPDGGEVSGSCRLSLAALGVAEIKGPLGAFKVRDNIEIRYCFVLQAVE